MMIEQLDGQTAQQALPQLQTLLQVCVQEGASIGFLRPLSDADADGYWQKVLAQLATPNLVLLIARDGTTILGTVQLQLETFPNGDHRGEVKKLLVHPAARGNGVATALMQALENAARAARRSLLVLDTRAGDVAEQLYLRLGYLPIGTIPAYARSPDGTLETCVFLYKQLSA